MVARLDLTGQVFGRWTVLSISHSNKYVYWNCLCECRTKKLVRADHLRSGGSKSCGCLQKELCRQSNRTHGMSETPEFHVWDAIIDRTTNPNNKTYHRYGGRGIDLCPTWENSFLQFYTDMGPKPSSKHTVERIDNSKGYYKENCRWATRQEQSQNTRRTVYLEWNGKKVKRVQLLREYSMPQGTFIQRLKRGWTIEKALLTPVRR